MTVIRSNKKTKPGPGTAKKSKAKVGGDDVEEFWVDTTKKGDKASTGYKADNHPMDLGSGFDFGGGFTGPSGSKTKFLQKMPPKQSVHDEPYKFTGDLDRKAYKKEMGKGF